MFDFTQGFTTIPAEPSPGRLNLQPEMDIQTRGFGEFGKGWGTLGSILGTAVGPDYVRAPDVTKIFDGAMWNYDEVRKVTSYDEQANLEHFLTVLGGGKQDIASMTGAAFEPTQIMVMRQLLGSGPLSPVSYGDSELAPEILAEDAKQLRELTKAQEGITPNPENLTPEQKQIVSLAQKLSFAEAKKQTQERVGFSWFDWMKESNIFWGGVNYLFDSPALKDRDIKETLTRKDPNFDPQAFWDEHTADPRVSQGLLERGITAEFIEDSPNAEHARFKIGQAYLTSHVQQRINTYKPTYTDYAVATAYALPKMMVEFMLDTPTGALLTPIHAAELVLSPLAPATSALGEMTAMRVATGVAESLYKLPIGLVPRWMEGTTLLSRIPAYFIAGSAVGASGGYARQAHEISFAAATMYANPFVRQDIDYGDIALESFYSGTQFAGMFGVGFGLIGTAKGVLDNRFKGMIVDPKTKARNFGDRRWSLEDTLLGNTIDKFRKRDSLIDVSPAERVKAEAILENKEATPERLAAEVEGRAERVETKEALSSPEKAEASPEDVGARKYETETVEQYTARLAPSRGFKELTEIATEVARRSPSENNNSRMLDTETELSAMSEQDKIRTLIRTKAVLEDARKKEEAAVGLPKERERVYDELESRRKAWIKNLRKDLTPLEFKKLKAEVLGERARNTTPLPKLLETAKNSSKPLAERKTAAVDAANEILEAARSAATNPEKAKVIVEKIPDELRDRFNAAVVEKKLTGTIAGETAEQIRASMLDEKAPAVETSIARSIRRSVSVSRLDPARVSKIAAIKRDYTKFVDLATGNKERATNLYLTVDEMFRRGLITKEDRVLLLASVVHLNFDMKGFDIRYKFEAMGDNTAGAYRASDKTLFINTNKIRASQTAVFLHELGHALFANEANGSIYLENLKLYNSIRSRPLENTYSFAKKDPLLRESGIYWYHFQNAEETFVELFSKVLLAEAGAVKDLSPAETSLVRSVFGSIQGAVVTAVTYLDSSKYYSSANKVIKMITDMDSAMVKENISVPALIRAFEVAESESKLESDVFRRAFGKEAINNKTRADAFNAAVKKYFEKQDSKYKTKFANSPNIPQLTEGEFTFLFKTMQDARGLAAFAISRKANKPLIDAKGAFTKEMKSFVDTYSIYKKTQYNSLLTRLAFLLESQSYKTILGMSKEERLDFVVYTLFDINARETKDARLDKPLPATYEDEPLALMNIGDGNYATDYLFTTGEDIVSALEKWDAPDVGTRDVLSAADRDSLVSSIRDNDIAMTPLIDMVRAKFDETGLMELGDRVVGKLHVSFIKKMVNESVFNKEDIRYSMEEPKQFSEGTIKDVLTKIATGLETDTITKDNIAVAKDLLNLIDEQTLKRVQVIRDEGMAKNKAGQYFEETNFVLLNPRFQKGQYTIHEIVHAAITDKVYQQLKEADISWSSFGSLTYRDVYAGSTRGVVYGESKAAPVKDLFDFYYMAKQENASPQMKAIATLIQLYKEACEKVSADLNKAPNFTEKLWSKAETSFTKEEKQLYYGLTSVNEFIAESVANPNFRELLNKYKTDSAKTAPETIGSRLLKTFKTLLGLESNTKPETLFDVAIPQIETLLQQDINRSSFVNSRLSIDTKQKAMGLIGGMLREKKLLAETSAEKILKSILRFDDATAERLLKASGKDTKKALEMAIRGIREEYLEYDGVNWTTKRLRVEADEAPVLPAPRKAKLVEKSKAVVDVKNVDSILMDMTKKGSEDGLEKDQIRDEAFGNVLGDMFTADSSRRTKLIEFIQEGHTPAEVRSYINKAIRREYIDIQRQRKLGTNEALQTEDGKTKEGTKPASKEKQKARDFNKDRYYSWLEKHKEFVNKTGVGIFSEEQVKFLKSLTKDRLVSLADGTTEYAPKTLEDLAKEWGLSGKSGARARIKALEARFAKVLGFTEEDKKLFFNSERNLTLEEIDSFTTKYEKAVEALTKKEEAPKPKEAAPEEPLPTSEEAAEAGQQIIEDQAIAAKMDAPSEPVPVLTSKTTEGHAVVETSNLPAAPEGEPPVVRTEKVADALVSAEDNMTKTAVKLEVKKAYSMSGVFTKSSVKALDRLVTLIALSEPRAMAKIAKEQRRQFVIDLLKEKGYDALVDEKGNVIPLDKIKIVGKVKKTKAVVENTEPGTEIKEVTKITTEGDNVPVVETTTQAVEPTAPTGVVSAVEADKPAIVQPVVKIESKVEPMPEEEVLERRANEDVKLLRENGMDRPFLRLFTKAYWKSGIEAKGKEALTDKLKAAWGDFTLVNQFIAEANRKIFGEDVMDRFWAKVDEINAKDRIRVKGVEDPTKVKPLTYTEVLDKAAEAMNEEGKPEFVRPLLPSEIKFVKADEAGNVRLSGKNKKTRAIIDEATKDQTVAEAPPVDRKLDAEGKEVAPTEEDLKPVDAPSDDTPRKTNDEVIDAAIDQNESGASRPWRLNTFAGWLFGGDSAANANWWRKIMAKLANATQSGSKLGNTIRSMIDDVAFLSRFADDGRAQTGHVVREGERARKTMLQIKMEEGMMITRVLRAYSMFADSTRGADRAAVNMYMYEQLRQGRDINRADLIALGVSPRTADAALKNGTYLMNIVRAVNNKVLYLERSTGRLATVDRNGIPLDPKMYAPVQFDHEALSRINPADYGTVIEAMARARRNTKLNDPRLDKNTMIVMGWIGVERDPKTGQVAIYDKNRILKHSEAVNMFTNETLSKLRTDEDGRQLPRVVKQGVAGNKALLKNLLKNSEPDKYFWIETDDAFTAYRLPRVIEDLGAADRLRYTEAVNGNTGMYIESWREWLGGKDLIYREMEEMFAYKTKQYPYNDANHGLLRPMFRIGENGPKGVMVHGLTPEEMLSDPLLSGLLRTNLSEAYFHWLRGRYFDLAFQSELDTVMGTTGINWEMITDRVQRKNIDNLKKIAHQAGWTNEQLKQAISDLTSGIERLNEEFRVGAETLPFLPSTSNKTTRLANAAIRYKFSVGYGISQFTEIMQELVKETPEFYRLPANIFKAIRYVVGDYRFSKNKLLMSELGDMTFVLESMKTDLSNRFMGETGYGTLSMDSQARTGMSRVAQRFRDAHGFGDKLITVFEAGADGMQALGSLGPQTQAVRALGKARIQRSVWKYFDSKAIDRLIENLDKPENAAMLEALKKAAAADQTVQPKLWKAFADVARKSGFGFDQHDAMMLRIYGFTEKETVEALRWAFSKTNHKDGRVNMHDLWDLVDYTRRENVKGINPDVLERAVSNYQFMIEDKITKEVASEVRGLNRNTNLAARSDLGRLWYSLTSFITSYQDNVIMNHARKNSIKYIAGGIFLYMVLDSLTSYFKEYLAGRQADDILKEMEDHPSDFFIRGMARTPFLGLYNSVLEMGMAGASALNGGTYRFYGIPLMPAGATAGVGALEDVYTDAKNIVAKPGVADKIKAASGLLGATDIINKHHIAIPVRVLEDLGAIERKSAIGTYLDIIHRKPYPYMKQGGYGTPAVTSSSPVSLEGYQVSPRNYAKESEDYLKNLEARYQQEYPKPKQTTIGSTSPNKGVSGILGDLLDNNQ